ncbi:MAG: SGNH/GDSL hydrolase family protein [Sphingomicrobium sp.]
MKHLILAAAILSGPTAVQAATQATGIVPNPCSSEIEQASKEVDIRLRDFGQLCRYRAANAELAKSRRPVRMVMIGDSITDSWIQGDPALFRGGIVDRGISGQTTQQMLIRFRADVIALRPATVHIMAGVNDIAGNTGPTTLEAIEDNIHSMVDLARAHRIKVMLASVLPAAAFPWAPDQRPVPLIAELNRRLKRYASQNGLVWVDYYGSLVNREGGMDAVFAADGVHPTAEGYRRMRPIALKALARTGRSIAHRAP